MTASLQACAIFHASLIRSLPFPCGQLLWVSPFAGEEAGPERRSDLPKGTQPKGQVWDSIWGCWPLESLLPTSLLWVLCKVSAALPGKPVRGPIGEMGEGGLERALDRLDVNRESLSGGNRREEAPLCLGQGTESLSQRHAGASTLENDLATSVRLKMVFPFI